MMTGDEIKVLISKDKLEKNWDLAAEISRDYARRTCNGWSPEGSFVFLADL